MKQIWTILLLCAMLCGCAAAGSGPQAAVPSHTTKIPTVSTSDEPDITTPIATIGKNPGLTIDPYDPEDKVPELTEEQIRQDYCRLYPNLTPDQIKLRFMGVFGQIYIMFVDVKDMMYADVITIDNVEGFRFVYSRSQQMQAWFEGEFYTLNCAYDAGLLTQEDLRTLSLDYYAAYPHLRQYVALPE